MEDAGATASRDPAGAAPHRDQIVMFMLVRARKVPLDPCVGERAERSPYRALHISCVYGWLFYVIK
jgi:hypothetical protein